MRLQTYRLQPVPGTETSHHWRASTIKPQCVWVLAKNQDDARQRVTLATVIATRIIPGHEVAITPWNDWGLVSCVEDNTLEVKDGFIRLENGSVQSIRD